MEINDQLKNIFDSLYDGILIIDNQGIVKYINPSYTRITKVEESQILNKYLLDVRKDSFLTSVMKSGEKKIGLYRTIENIKYLVNMVPIFEDGKIIGGISVVNDLQDVQRTLDQTLLTLNSLKEKIKSFNKNKYNFESIVAIDRNTIQLKKYLKKISLNDSNILIIGEIGTGKEVFARAIHSHSPRAHFPFISLSCSSLTKSELEKELFGDNNTEKKEKGILQLIEGGTLFLDDISELDYSLQNKLLKVLEKKSFEEDNKNKGSSNFRLICSTSKNLLELVNLNLFKIDLYYKISVIPVNIPPLKNRKADIPIFANKFLNELSLKYRKEVIFSEEVLSILSNYDWPGNIRELKNIVEFLFNIVEGKIITIDNLPEQFYFKKKFEKIKTLSDFTKDIEKKYISKVLKNFENNLEGKKQAASALGISLATLYNKL